MTKMYGEMQEMRENMATKQDIVRLENKMDTNHRALYDGYKLIKKDPPQRYLPGITRIMSKET